jgi:small subunit ribosomal protein S17
MAKKKDDVSSENEQAGADAETAEETTDAEAQAAADESAAAEEVEAEVTGAADGTADEPAAPADEVDAEAAAAAAAAAQEAEEPVETLVPDDGAEEAGEPSAAAEVEGAPPSTAGAPAVEPKRKRKRLPRALRRQRPKPKRPQGGGRKPIVRLEKPEHDRGRRQERQGTVVSDAMDKTIVVKVDVIKAHPRYRKVVRRSVKFHAHDEQNQAKIGDIVRIVETRPLSATKRWRLVEIVEAAR